MYWVGIILGSLNRDQESYEMHAQTLELRKKVLGVEHKDTLNSMYSVGIKLSSINRDQESYEMHAQTLELRKKVLGVEHADTL